MNSHPFPQAASPILPPATKQWTPSYGRNSSPCSSAAKIRSQLRPPPECLALILLLSCQNHPSCVADYCRSCIFTAIPRHPLLLSSQCVVFLPIRRDPALPIQPHSFPAPNRVNQFEWFTVSPRPRRIPSVRRPSFWAYVRRLSPPCQLNKYSTQAVGGCFALPIPRGRRSSSPRASRISFTPQHSFFSGKQGFALILFFFFERPTENFSLELPWTPAVRPQKSRLHLILTGGLLSQRWHFIQVPWPLN